MKQHALLRLLLVVALIQPQALWAARSSKGDGRIPSAEPAAGPGRRGVVEPVREISEIAAPLGDAGSTENKLEPEPGSSVSLSGGEDVQLTPAAPAGQAPADVENGAVSGPVRRPNAPAAGARRGRARAAAPASAAPAVDFDGTGLVRSGEIRDISFNRKMQEPPRDQAKWQPGRKPAAKKAVKTDKDGRPTNAIRDGLKSSKISKALRLLSTSGKEWHWTEHFQEGTRVRVTMGNRTVFISQIEKAETKKISQLKPKDLQGTGYFNPVTLRRSKFENLIEKLKAKLAEYGDKVTNASLVRILSFLPYDQARELEINRRREHAAKIGPREPVEVPQSLKPMRDVLPKLVLLDLRMFPNGVPPGVVDDMGKLLKDGVHITLITDKPATGPGSIQEQLSWGLGDEEHDQHDKLVRYKLSVLADNGNALMAFKGNFLENLPSPRFGEGDLDLMTLAANKLGAAEIESRQGDRLVVILSEGTDLVAFTEAYRRDLNRVGIRRYHLESAFVSGRNQVILRPTNLPEGLARLYSDLQQHSGLYIDNEDVFVISENPELLALTPNSIHASRHMPGLHGPELAETAFAAMLGDYRVMGPADLAASASMIKGVKQDKDKYFNKTSDEETVEILIGHVVHSAFNWAVKIKRDTGALPTLDRMLAEADHRWERSYGAEERNLLRNPSDSIADAKMRMLKAILPSMYNNVKDLLDKYPIILGTEMPHLTSMQRYAKGGVPLYRNFIRTTFDLVVARETPQGLDVLYLDLKSGQTHDLDWVKKDFQYQLYDFVAQRTKVLPVPYNVEGRMTRVAKAAVGFLYPQRLVVPEMSEDDRTKFSEKTLPSAFDALRRSFAIEIPKIKPVHAPRPRAPRKSAAAKPLIAADSAAWDALGAGDRAVYFAYADSAEFDAAVRRAVARGAKGAKLYDSAYLKRLGLKTFAKFSEKGEALKKRGVESNWSYSFTESGSTFFVQIKGAKKDIEALAKTIPLKKAWLGREGESIARNRLFMANAQAFENAANGVSTVYIRRGAGFGYDKGRGRIVTKDGDQEIELPVEFESVQEMRYQDVGPDVLDGLAPGLTWDEMLSQMKQYYPPKPERNDPGFSADNVVTVIRYRRR